MCSSCGKAQAIRVFRFPTNYEWLCSSCVDKWAQHIVARQGGDVDTIKAGLMAEGMTIEEFTGRK